MVGSVTAPSRRPEAATRSGVRDMTPRHNYFKDRALPPLWWALVGVAVGLAVGSQLTFWVATALTAGAAP